MFAAYVIFTIAAVAADAFPGMVRAGVQNPG